MRVAELLRRFREDRGGSLAVLFAFMAIVVLGVAGIALDFGRSNNIKSRMQQALDAAVIAGAHAPTGQEVATATAFFNSNFVAPDLKGLTLSFITSGNETTGTASGTVNTSLASVLGFKNMTIGAAAKAVASGGGQVCVLVLNPTASQSLLVNSGANVSAPDCEIHVSSTANPAAIFNAGSDIDTQRICIKGSTIIDNGGTHPNLYKSCPTAADPFAGQLPVPASSSCTYSNLNFNGGTVTLNPGVYCGWTNFNNGPTVNLNPGVYVIKNGGWNVNGGRWTGSGVTFYFADQSKIQFNSAVAASITAPTVGTYANIVMYEKSGLARSQFVFDDSRGMNLTGLIYLPSRDVTFNHGSGLTAKEMTLVVNTLILDGTNWDLEPSANEIAGGSSDKYVRLIQ